MLSKRQKAQVSSGKLTKRQRRSTAENEALSLTSKSSSNTVLGIAYRDDQNGRGAFTDHYTIRRATGKLTAVLAPESVDLTHFHHQQQQYTAHGKEYPLSLPLCTGSPTVFNHQFSTQTGGLIIPGLARGSEKGTALSEDKREVYEHSLIREARNRGMPILGLCAGSWRLWQHYGGQLKPAQNHCYGGGMFYIKKDGNVGVNKQIHRISVNSTSLLARAMQLPTKRTQPAVNSVHWLAPDIKTLPEDLQVSASAVPDEAIAPNSRQGSTMKVEKKTVEAFETKHGAPVLAIQWHGEAYCDQTSTDSNAKLHQNIFQFFAKSAETYKEKQEMLSELKNSPPKLNPVGR